MILSLDDVLKLLISYHIDKIHKILPSTEIRTGLNDDSRAVIVVFQYNKTQYLGCGPTDPSVTIHLFDSQRVTIMPSIKMQ